MRWLYYGRKILVIKWPDKPVAQTMQNRLMGMLVQEITQLMQSWSVPTKAAFDE